ncbi:hypothetical protein D3C81_1088930 [compost metagenome]
MCGEAEDQQAERAGEVAVDHLVPAFLRFHRRFREVHFGMGQLGFAARHVDEAIAARPVRTAEAGVGQAGVGTEQHDDDGQYGSQHREVEAGFAFRFSHSSSPFLVVLVGRIAET